MGINLSKLIDEYLRRGDEHPRDQSVFYPSEIPQCLRMTWFRYKLPKPWPSEKLRLFQSAIQAHEFMSRVLAKAKGIRLVSSEKPFSLIYGDFQISGRMDDLIWIESEELAPWAGSRLVPIEVKTISGRWQSMEHLEAKREHRMQLMCYLRAERVPAGIIFYMTRDDFRDKSFVCKYDPKLMEEVVNRARLLHERLIQRRIPEPEAKIRAEMSWVCRYCLYEDLCKQNIVKV